MKQTDQISIENMKSKERAGAFTPSLISMKTNNWTSRKEN